MVDSSSQTIVINGSVAQVAEVICDFPRYPEWAGGISDVRVLREHPDGRAAQVSFRLDAGPVRDTYELAYGYAEASDGGLRVEWHLVEPSTMQKAQTGSYDIADNGDGTCTVTYTLAVELSIGMLGMFRRKAEKTIMDTALKELKRRVESRAADEGGGDE